MVVTKLDGALSRNKFGAPVFQPKVFWEYSKYVVLKKVLLKLLVLLGAPSDPAPRAFCPPCPLVTPLHPKYGFPNGL